MGENRYFPGNYHPYPGTHAPDPRHYPPSAHSGRPEPTLRAPADWHGATQAAPSMPSPQPGFGIEHDFGDHPGYARNTGYRAQGHAAPQFVAPDAHSRGKTPPAPTPPLRPQALLQGLGAVLSLALVMGAGFWSWQMMQRDVSGVPVVRALEGPTRVAPADPGGRQAAYQGFAVNDLAAASVSDDARDTIILAPPPVDLSARDLVQPAVQNGSAAAPVEVALTQDLPFEAQDAEPMAGTGQAVTRSLRPQPRAAGVGQRVAALTPAPATGVSDVNVEALAASIAAGIAGGVRDIDPATIGPGTRLVQLGAFDDAQAARDAWDQLSRRFSPLLDDRGRVIEAAHSGGSVFFRLRAHGFTDERDARRFCASLIAQSLDCIPVLIR